MYWGNVVDKLYFLIHSVPACVLPLILIIRAGVLFLPMKSHIPLKIDMRVFSVVLEADAACFRIAAALLLTLYNLSTTSPYPSRLGMRRRSKIAGYCFKDISP